MLNSKGKCKVGPSWLHAWHFISKHTVRNGSPCKKNARIHRQLPVFSEQISSPLIWSLSGRRSETQGHLRRCEASAERWQLGVCTHPQTKQHFGRHSKLPAHFHAQWKRGHSRSEGQLCQRSLSQTGFKIMSEHIAKVLKDQASPLDHVFKVQRATLWSRFDMVLIPFKSICGETDVANCRTAYEPYRGNEMHLLL